MPKIEINYQSSHSVDETYSKVKTFLETDKSFESLDKDFKVDFNDSAKSGDASGSKFKANFSVKDSGSGADFTMIIDLPFKYALLKGVVQSTVEKKISKVLG